MTWTEWSELDAFEKASAIAHYRLHLLVEAHVGDAATKASERAANKARKPKSR